MYLFIYLFIYMTQSPRPSFRWGLPPTTTPLRGLTAAPAAG